MGKKYIVVDDDKTNNMICELTISKFEENADIHLFTEPEKGLEFLKEDAAKNELGEAILFLDINMPTMTGWEFLDEFINFQDQVKGKVTIYILSSSLEDFSEKAEKYPFVSGFLSKPLETAYLVQMSLEQKEISGKVERNF